MSEYQTIWHKTWEGREIRRSDECGHPCGDNLTINQRLEKHDRGHRIALDGDICMICGIDKLHALSLADGLGRCMDEHGWNCHVGRRLYDLADYYRVNLQEAERVPVWFAYAWGWDFATIKAALEAANAEPHPTEGPRS